MISYVCNCVCTSRRRDGVTKTIDNFYLSINLITLHVSQTSPIDDLRCHWHNIFFKNFKKYILYSKINFALTSNTQKSIHHNFTPTNNIHIWYHTTVGMYFFTFLPSQCHFHIQNFEIQKKFYLHSARPSPPPPGHVNTWYGISPPNRLLTSTF